MAKKNKQKAGRARFTDNSGVLISRAEYAGLHGERPVNHKDHFGMSAINTNARNIFAEIAKLDTYVDTKTVKMLECEYCNTVVQWDEIGKHTRKLHRTSDLRFISAGERTLPVKQMRDSKGGVTLYRSSLPDSIEKSNGMAQMRREGNGQFGSFPLHDNYDDESDAK